MGNTTRQRSTHADSHSQVPDEGGAPASLADTRADMDGLFAVAARSFETMTEGDSQEFLRRSRQTGGQ